MMIRAKHVSIHNLVFDLLLCSTAISNSASGLPIYDFLLVFNSNVCPNSGPLRDTCIQNVSLQNMV